MKQIVDELLINKILIFEKYIGLNNVPAPNNQLIQNTNEGIICRVNCNNFNLINKKYKWQDSSILFLHNGYMNAFGDGTYHFINKYLVKCYFGNREHLLKFNQDYSIFTSIRKDDNQIVIGNQL